MPRVTRDDVVISYSDEGRGKPLLLIHGHTFDRRIWDDVVAPLVAAGRRVLRPDLRGHGRSSCPDRGFHHRDHAADMVAVLEHAGATPAAVVGYSIGGAIALEMALEHPRATASLVLVDPVLPDRPFEPEFFANLKEVARTIRADGVEAAMVGPWLDGPLLRPSYRTPGVRERVREIVRDFPGADYVARERDRVERDWTVPERLPEIEVETVVVSAERTLPGFRAWADEIAASIPHARHEVVEGVGHLLPVEDPAALLGAWGVS